MVVKTQDRVTQFLQEVRTGDPGPDLTEGAITDVLGFVRRYRDAISKKFSSLSGSNDSSRKQIERDMIRELENKGHPVKEDNDPGFFRTLTNRLLKPIGNALIKVLKYTILPFRQVDSKYTPDISAPDIFFLGCASIAMLHMNFPMAALFLTLKGMFKFTQDVFRYISTGAFNESSSHITESIAEVIHDDPFEE